MSKKFAYITVSQTSSSERQHLLIQPHFTCVLTLCCFVLKVEKTPLRPAKKVRHSPFSYQIFALQVKTAIPVGYVQGHGISTTKEQKHVRQSTFLSL
jgi:hypothetical protein